MNDYHYVSRHHTIKNIATIKNIIIKLASGISFILYPSTTRGIYKYTIMILYKSVFFLYYWICVYFFFVGIFVAIFYNISRFGNSLYTSFVILSIFIPGSTKLDSHQRYFVIDKLTYISP